VAALLGARALVLDVVAGHAGLDEAADQVAHVRVAAVAGVGVGDDERPVVVGRRRGALRLAHAQRWKCWLRSAVSRRRTSVAASSGTCESG
jgi:hypothetical protein